MEQPIINERTEDRGLSDRLEGIEDELQLLKSEVKQTLIDLREFMMKGSAMSVTSDSAGPKASSSNGQVIASERQESRLPREQLVQPEVAAVGAPKGQEAPALQESLADPQVTGETQQNKPVPEPTPMTPPIPFPEAIPAPVFPSITGDRQGKYSIDAIKMGHIIRWLGTVARKGLTPTHLKPYLLTYEQSGLLTSEMAALTYRSLEDLEYAMGRTHQTYSSSEYSDCLLELHEIICNPGYAPKQDSQSGWGHHG